MESCHPWSMAGFVVKIAMLLHSCPIAPSLQAWKLVMHLFSVKSPILSIELFNNAGRMCAHCASGQSCIIGINVVAEVLATFPKATTPSLEGDQIMDCLLMGLLK